MSKEELKNYIKKLALPEELEQLIVELIDNAKQVDKALLNAVADVLDLQADFYEKEANVLGDVADEYESLSEELNLLDEEENLTRVNAIKENQEQLLTEINKKLDELKVTPQSTQETAKIEEIKQTLQQQTQ